MGNLQGFNADEHYNEDRGVWTPIPVGKVLLSTVMHSQWKPTKDGKGRYLYLQFQVLEDGDFKGRQLEARLNLENQNPKAVQIANEELAELCRALGNDHPNDSSELHDIPVYLKVGQQKYTRNDGSEGVGNTIKRYISRAQQEAASSTSTSPTWAGGAVQ